MKTDMTGAGAVAAPCVARRAPPASGAGSPGCCRWPRTRSAPRRYRPGDVVRHYGGRTVEVVNTDAEGRLVLADALAYADAHLDPAVVSTSPR